MNTIKNRKTLKRRLRHVISLSIFITIVVFSIAITLLFTQVLKNQAIFLSTFLAHDISSEINSPHFLDELEINSLKELDPYNYKVLKFIDELHMEDGQRFDILNPYLEKHSKEINPNQIQLSNIRKYDVFTTRIEVNNKLFFQSKKSDSPIIKELSDQYESSNNTLSDKIVSYINTETSQPIYDTDGLNIGYVSVKINPAIIILAVFFLISSIILLAIFSLLFANFLCKPFTYAVVRPMDTLVRTVNAVAQDDFNNYRDSKIVVKRPLREIQILVNSTNAIIDKFKNYNNELTSQKLLLENQYEELEAQNEELTESKHKIEETQTQLVQVQNMAQVGQLTAAILHEINTPLGAINSNVQMNEMFLTNLLANELVINNPDTNEILNQFNEINKTSVMACKRINDIIKSLKIFSKIDQAEFQKADINEGIKSTVILTSNLWKKRIKLIESYGDIPLVMCYPALLNQVFMNIIVNAIHSIEGTGFINISTIQSKENVIISIKDTGSGIPEENLSKIFEAGFTTKKGSVGMGIGLAICKDIIIKHNAKIEVNSNLDEGTEFVITLPITQ